ncbi:MAG: hypothetical protein KGI79_01365 [Patescibacteria group bacterium]|nr:hypothetical protein [Patescibacteria group bacterium]MDE2116507.1 hypothetical protein [Patescibacteria group bacterium]
MSSSGRKSKPKPKHSIGRQIAERIAALRGEAPEFITVKMVGSRDVERFIRMITDAQKRNHAGPGMIFKGSVAA